MISHYKMVATTDVDKWLLEGWMLYGSPVITPNGYVYQAVVLNYQGE